MILALAATGEVFALTALFYPETMIQFVNKNYRDLLST
jgi:hypothetical protein